MTLSAATVHFGPDGPVLTAAPPLPVEALVLGRKLDEAAEILPRLFNLCRAAQGLAARLALGLPAPAGSSAAIAAERTRDHRLKLCLTLRHGFGLPPLPIDTDLTGLPLTAAALLSAPSPVADLARRIAETFAPGIATCAALPTPPDPLASGACENSAAGRQAHHPLLQDIAARHGRGPLWRYAGILADLATPLPAARDTDGIVSVPAARGSYALRITHRDGRVTGITRRTPTDHLLAPGGALLQALSALPPSLQSLAPQVIALHDPCIPVTVKEVQDA